MRVPTWGYFRSLTEHHDSEGQATLTVCDNYYAGFNSIGRPASIATSNPMQQTAVRTRRLDDVLQEEGVAHVDVMKIDVEGAEVAVMKGARALLSREDAPAIICEISDATAVGCNSSAREVVHALHSFGYSLYDLRQFAARGLVKLELPPALSNGRKASLSSQAR